MSGGRKRALAVREKAAKRVRALPGALSPAASSTPALPDPSHGSRPYVRRLDIASFGAFSGRAVGPFEPGLNVVFGKNEAGKTTLAAFIGGVLFGWEEARGFRNTYRPEHAERAGAIVFSNAAASATGGKEGAPRADGDGAATDDGEELRVFRGRNADGIAGAAHLVEDIDRETFRTMFSLTSDELRGLRNTTDVTAKLLTAGSGTGSSPAQALSELQARIASFTSRAQSADHSLLQLSARRDDLREQIAQAVDEAERFRRQDEELSELEPQRRELAAQQQRLNDEIEKLVAAKATLERLDEEIARNSELRDELVEQRRSLDRTRRARASELDEGLASLSPADERTLREHIDALLEEQGKLAHSVDAARETYLDSKSRYDALLEMEDAEGSKRRARRQRFVLVALSVALPVLFMAFGIPVFLHGRTITSLSFTALGVLLIVFALFLGGAALAMLFRPSKEEEAAERREQNSRWVMTQDKNKLESCEAALSAQRVRIREFLDGAGLVAANGSLRQARTLLDEAAALRSEAALAAQQRQAVISQIVAAEGRIARAQEERASVLAAAGLAEGARAADIARAIEQRAHQRAGLQETAEGVNRRCGELKQVLAQACDIHRLDELKLELAQVVTRIGESERELARLLLAQRMLATAVTSWESKSQPEVYRRASQLLSTMTAGRWTRVRMGEDGRLFAVDWAKTERDPSKLSLGTCQQLYLSLRVALLLAADNVGRAIPVIADDILVTFDEERARGAARVLAELAQHRQVILLTCHRSTVELVREADPSAHVIEL